MDIIDLKPIKLDLNFFKNKDKINFNLETLDNLFFQGTNYTSNEKLYLLTKALESLEILAPIEMTCPKCGKTFTTAFEFAKYLTLEDFNLEDFKTYNSFIINHKDLILKFERPANVASLEPLLSKYKSNLANFAVYMEAWLAETNKEDFNLNDLNLTDLMGILKEFKNYLLIPSFYYEERCPYCNELVSKDVSIRLEDIVLMLQNI